MRGHICIPEIMLSSNILKLLQLLDFTIFYKLVTVFESYGDISSMLTWHIFKNFLFSKRSGALIRTIARVCVIGIGVGVFALVVVIGVMGGFNLSIQDRLLKVEPHVIVEFDNK